MTTQKPQVRRATVEDVPKLVALWEGEGLPAQALEKRFKEFQVIEGSDGSIAGVVGLEISGLEGRLHSEAFAQPEQADGVRTSFWERLQVLGQNHGLVRVWTQFSTPFWTHSGFQVAPPDTLAKRPEAFGNDPHPWRFIQLRPEPANAPSIEKEFAMFKEMENERTARLLQQAKVMKLVAAIVVLLVFILVGFWIVTWYRAQGRLPR